MLFVSGPREKTLVRLSVIAHLAALFENFHDFHFLMNLCYSLIAEAIVRGELAISSFKTFDPLLLS